MSKSREILLTASAGNVVLVTMKSWIHDLVMNGQSSITPDHEPSRWGHTFIMGIPREDGEVRIYESDIYFTKNGLKNGAQENTISKYSRDDKNVAICIIDFNLNPEEVNNIITEAQNKIDEGIQYPILELIGTLWAYITKTFRKPNPLNLKQASYCSAFVNNCFSVVEPIVPESVVHHTNVSPEHIYRSEVRGPTRRELVL